MGDLMLFDENDTSNVPAHIRSMMGQVSNSDLTAGVTSSFPILSYKGKSWHISQGGTRTLIADDQGEPRPSIEVVILKSNPHISKIFYEGGYVEGSDERPTCYSNDGITPAMDAAVKQANKCAICPRNQWGSRTTESGAKGKECSDSRRLAVAPSGEIDNPMLLRVPAATLKELMAYASMLDRRKTPYAAVVTKIGFDHSVAFPKLTFKPIRWLDPSEIATVAATIAGPLVAAITADNGESDTEVDEIAGERPANIDQVLTPARAKALASEAEVLAAVSTPKPAEVVKPKPQAFAPEVVKAAQAALVAETTKTAAPVVSDADAKRAALMAQLAELDKPAEVAEPVAEVKPKRDHAKLLTEATASLDDVLGILDDE